MNLDNSGATCTSSSVSNLINKLCLHLSRNNAGRKIHVGCIRGLKRVVFLEVSSNLFKLAINFLSSSSSGSRTTFTTTGDEQFVVAQIRKYLLATQNREAVEKFDLLYASFQKSVRENNPHTLFSLMCIFLVVDFKSKMCHINVFNESGEG